MNKFRVVKVKNFLCYSSGDERGATSASLVERLLLSFVFEGGGEKDEGEMRAAR
jgi:hypothetical protein